MKKKIIKNWTLKCSKFQHHTDSTSEWCTHSFGVSIQRYTHTSLIQKRIHKFLFYIKSICFQTNVFRVDESLQFSSSRKTPALCYLLENFSGFQQVISLTNIFTCIIRRLISCIFFRDFYPVRSFTDVKWVCHSQLC